MDHGVLLLLELGAVVLGLGVLARVAGRVSISPIPLYLIAGLAFGEGGIAPIVTSEDFIEIGAELGVIFLLLLLGLEYSARELITSMRAVAPAGTLDLVLNFAPGLVTGLLLGWGLNISLFLGGVTYISSSGVVAKLVNDLGWSANSETPVILSVLVFEDLVMAAMLPILAAVALGSGAGQAALSIAIAFAVIAAALTFAYRHGDRIGQLVFHASDEVTLLSVFGLALVVAGLAEAVSVSAAVGAFLVGIALSGEAAAKAHSLLTPLRDLFAAVFFVFFGLSTDPGEIPGVMAVALVLGIVTMGTKMITGWWAAQRSGIARPGRVRAGLALIARGEFSIIIAGLAGGLAGADELAALAAAYVLFMAVAGPIAAKFAGIGRPKLHV